MMPIRCFSCGKLLAQFYEEIQRKAQKKENLEKAFTEMGIVRYCCRRTLFSHVDLTDEVTKFNL